MPYKKCVNAEQENAIEKLKNRIKNELTSPALLQEDAIFYKFLKARNFDIDKAEKMLRKVFVKYGEPNFIGYDKEGDLVIFTAVAGIDSANWSKCIKINDTLKHYIWFAEKNKALANKTKNKVSACVIVDLDKLEFSNATSKLTIDNVLRIAYVLRDNYAERVKAIYIINGGWMEKLVEAIDADILPAFLGGKRFDPDGDPYCKSFITLPGIIPESYYLSEEDRYFGHSDEI